MKTLIYIGAHTGVGLYRLLEKRRFDVIYAFEPDPEMFEQLKANYSHISQWPEKLQDNVPQITCINAACSKETGPKILYITENRVSSSLSDVNMLNQGERGHSGGIPAFKTIEIHSINLKEFCNIHNIKHIDMLVTDCQGSDYEILTTMKEFIDEKRIDELFCETHKDGMELYVGLDNSFSLFKSLLGENYKISHFCFDTYHIDVDDLTLLNQMSGWNEWDTSWKLQ